MDDDVKQVDQTESICDSINSFGFAMLVALFIFRARWTLEVSYVIAIVTLIVTLLLMLSVKKDKYASALIPFFVIFTAIIAPSIIISLGFMFRECVSADTVASKIIGCFLVVLLSLAFSFFLSGGFLYVVSRVKGIMRIDHIEIIKQSLIVFVALCVASKFVLIVN